MRQKFIGSLLVLIVIFTGCTQHVDKEADYKNKVKSFSEQYPHVNVELSEVKEKNGEFIGRFMFLEESVVNQMYQKLIVDYLLTNVLDLENIKSVDVSFFLKEEEKKHELKVQYNENKYKYLYKKFTNEKFKQAIHLCFTSFDQGIPFVLDQAIEVIIFLRIPDGKFKYSFIDFFFYDELEGKSIREQGYDKVKVLNDLVEMYDLTKFSKKERNDISAEDEKISVFINDLFSIFYGYQPSNPSTLQ